MASAKAQSRQPSAASTVTAVEPSLSQGHAIDAEKKKEVTTDGAEVTETEAYDAEFGNLKTLETKKLSWIQASALLFGEYVVIAILSFANSYSVLGMAGGLLATVIVGLVTLATSHLLWRYCLKNPHLVDICVIGRELFGGSRLAYELTMFGFVLNNLFIQGLHVLSGSIALNTLSDHATCTIVWTLIFLAVMFTFSLFRELKRMAVLSIIGASTMFVALILAMAFAGAESGPAGLQAGEPVVIRAWAAPGTTFVEGLNALLNIVYTSVILTVFENDIDWQISYVGQVLVPTYVQDMERPEDFPKALYLVTTLEMILFSLGGGIIYGYAGQYSVAPAYGSLQPKFAKVVAAFTIPTIVTVGILYAVITSRVIYYRIFGADSIHVHRVTKKGTAVWVTIVTIVWIISWVLGEAIPFFSDLLALMSSLFDSFFGFIFWGVAYFRLYRGEEFKTIWRCIETVFFALMIVVGLAIFGAGTYTSAKAIANNYASGTVAGAFTCANNGF